MAICGGIFKDKNQDKEPIIPWISQSQHLPRVKLMKGPCHIGILWPMIARHTKVVQDEYMMYK
eukprot:13726253-Ditylum_brightwellii.AAC.2